MLSSKPVTLNYVINKPRGRISLNLYEAERYEPAIIVQSLVGNLVYFSNRGRYEPRLATSWSRSAPNVWTFELLPNLKAENGELITASTFKASIQRTLRVLSKSGPFPVLMHLRGYSDFVSGKSDLEGIAVHGNSLTFKFDQPLRDGLLQILSFAPFGFIAEGNLKPDGSWKDETRFISSGPYKVSSIEIGKSYKLSKREDWVPAFADGSPDQIEFTLDVPTEFDFTKAWIVDSFTATLQLPSDLKSYPLVPEYLNPILVGGLSKGYFSSIERRRMFKALIVKHRGDLPPSWGTNSRSETLYPNVSRETEVLPDPALYKFPAPSAPLRIEGEEPKDDSPRATAWTVLRKALNEAQLPYVFNGNATDMKFLSDGSFDFRLRGASAGGGPEAWGLKILFCSDLGPRLPDPNLRVCHLIEEYESDHISEQEFSSGFMKATDEEAAIIPVSHYGIQLYLSPKVDRSSLSPTISIIRFDQLKIGQ